LLLDVPHRRVVFTIPRMLRIFFKYNRRLLGQLCLSALRSLTCYFAVVTGSELMPGVIAAIQTFGARINFHPHLHFLATEGGVDEAGAFHKISRLDDSRLAEIFAREVLRFLVHKELLSPEWADRPLPSQGWAEMIRKVYEVNPLVRPQCGATMKVIAFLTDYAVVDRIIDHLKLTFVAERPPPPHLAYQESLVAAETSGEYLS
jgi:hypothetical protein